MEPYESTSSSNSPYNFSLTQSKKSNIISIESLPTFPSSPLLKSHPLHQGKLFRGPVYTAYKKESLGSIPLKVEKSLIEDKKNQNKIGFCTTTSRFICENKSTPGPGAYNISISPSLSLNCTKGFSNCFISNTERFNTTSLNNSKYTPGPGNYNPEMKNNLYYDITSSIWGKSLYNTKKTFSLKPEKNIPGPGEYNPQSKFNNTNISNIKNEDSVFKSKVNRLTSFNFNGSNNFNDSPGPGMYFNNILNNIENNTDGKGSYFFKLGVPKRYNELEKLEKLNIKTKQKKDDCKFKLMDKKGKIQNIMIADNKNNKNEYVITKKDLFKIRNKLFIKECNKKSENILNTDGNINSKNLKIACIEENMDTNNDINSDNEANECIHKILKNKNKPDIFELNAPRWKNISKVTVVPGPAYYHPRKVEKVQSFNRNKNDFIWTNGVVDEEMDEDLV